MSIIARRSATRKNKKEIILEKAIEVFAEKGAQNCTVADIAKRAKIAQGTVYVYFSSKEELLNECMHTIITNEINQIIEATKDIPDTMDRLFHFFTLHISLVKEKPFIARFLTVEARQSEDFYLQFPGYNPLQRYIDYVKEIGEQAIAEGRIRSLDIEAFALLIVGAMDLTMAQWLLHKDTLDIGRVASGIRDILKLGVNE